MPAVLYIFIIGWRDHICLFTGTAVFIAVAAITVRTIHMSVRYIEKATIERGSPQFPGLGFAVCKMDSIGNHHIFRLISGEIKIMILGSVVRDLNTPVMFI